MACCDEENDSPLSHNEVVEEIQTVFSQILTDKLLNELPYDISAEEVYSQLLYEQGKAMKITVLQEGINNIPIIVPAGGTVLDLMKGFEKAIARKLKNERRSFYISWKYIWTTFSLTFGHQKLTERQATLLSYGINKNEEVHIRRK